MDVLQVPAELDQMRDLYIEKRPRRVLEIGVWHGGTACEWLRHATEGAVVVAVDLDHRNAAEYEEWRKPGTTLHAITGSSQDENVKEQIRTLGPYDWVFIDGDHDAGAVASDAELCLPLISSGGLMLLHDVVPGPGQSQTGPGRLLERLIRDKHDVRVIVEPPLDDYKWAHGIGIVQL